MNLRSVILLFVLVPCLSRMLSAPDLLSLSAWAVATLALVLAYVLVVVEIGRES